jgi:hypothetical protein
MHDGFFDLIEQLARISNLLNTKTESVPPLLLIFRGYYDEQNFLNYHFTGSWHIIFFILQQTQTRNNKNRKTPAKNLQPVYYNE